MPNETIDPGASSGDEDPDRYEEFLKLFARDRDRVYSYIYSLLPHHADAEDIFQRCSILLWRKFTLYDRGRSFLSWACGFAYHEVCNFLRVAGRDRLRFDPDLIGQLAECRMESLEQDEDRLVALRLCLEKLDAPEQELIRHAYGGDRPIKELAEGTGLAVQTLYNQLSRIRHKLFHCVQRALAQQGSP